MDSALSRKWGLIALRGAAAILFGVITLLNPAVGLGVLIFLFAALAFFDGIFAVVAAIANRRHEKHWVGLLLTGLLGIAVGACAVLWPAMTAVALIYFIAVWAIVAGIGEIATAIRLRKVISDEWLLLLTGVLSVGFGIGLALFPGAGALALIIWIGAVAIVIGVLRIIAALRLRGLQKEATGTTD